MFQIIVLDDSQRSISAWGPYETSDDAYKHFDTVAAEFDEGEEFGDGEPITEKTLAGFGWNFFVTEIPGSSK